MVRLRLLCVLAGCFVLLACGAEPSRTVQVSEQEPGRTVELRRGDQLVIVLDGNPTTGYVWEQVGGDASVIVPAGEPTFVPDSSALGSGGTVTMRFSPAGIGVTQLRLAYHRTFEPNDPPLKTFDVTVVVSDR
ncbi:MAG: hypothetical protein RLZZ387_622 [Chloroflexota bacterium]|jgi:inhibitor of cysteine peptidase